jgi:hypothetical protein
MSQSINSFYLTQEVCDEASFHTRVVSYLPHLLAKLR